MARIKLKKGPSLTIILLLLLSLFNQGVSTDQAIIDKQKGVTLVSWSANQLLSPDSDQSINQIRSTGADWISLIVTQYQDNIRSKVIEPGKNTPTDEALAHAIDEAHSHGMKVLLKPHVDLSDDPGHWRAEIGMGFSLKDWQQWFSSYRDMILHYAELAQTYKVDEFCVGTELELASPHSGQWREIVAEVRRVYDGPLTYAANHSGEEFFLSWWDSLDYIGIDAYYSLSVRSNPSLAELELAWQQFLLPLRGLYNTWHKPIIFTELGYRSVSGAAQAPYIYIGNGYEDLNVQALAYEAFFKEVYWQPWFGGVFWWDWVPDPYTSGQCGTDYTPFEKPAEAVLRAGFGGLPKLSLPQPQPDDLNTYPIYWNELAPGWRDTSWANTTKDKNGPSMGQAHFVTDSATTGNYLKVIASPDQAFTLSVQQKPFDTSPYQWIELLVQAETPQQTWNIRLVDSNLQSVRSLPINNCRYLASGVLEPNVWQHVLIPLKALMGEDHNLNSIILSNATSSRSILWIEQIQFVAKK